MKKLTFKSATKSLQTAVMDGAVIYGGRLGYRLIEKQVSSLIPAAIPAQVHGAVIGAIGVIAGDMLLPQKYSRIFGAAVASEVVEGFVAPFVEPMLIKANLLPGGAAAAAGYGKMNGYGKLAGISGMASFRRMADATGLTH